MCELRRGLYLPPQPRTPQLRKREQHPDPGGQHHKLARLRNKFNPQDPNSPRVAVPGRIPIRKIPLDELRSHQLDCSLSHRGTVIEAGPLEERVV
jgi:hypothetical protein